MCMSNVTKNSPRSRHIEARLRLCRRKMPKISAHCGSTTSWFMAPTACGSQIAESWPSPSSKKIEREIEQLELALETCYWPWPGRDEVAHRRRVKGEPAPDDPLRPRCRRLHVSSDATRASARELDPGHAALTVAAICALVGEDVSELLGHDCKP